MGTTDLNISTAFFCLDMWKEKMFYAKTEEDIQTYQRLIDDVMDFLDRIEVGKIKI